MPFETVLLPFSLPLQEVEQAAQAFFRQYRVGVQIEIRGHLILEDDTYCLLPEWFHVHAINVAHTRLGLGEETDRELLWVQPAGPGEYRLSPYARSKLAHVEQEDRDTIKADRYFMAALTLTLYISNSIADSPRPALSVARGAKTTPGSVGYVQKVS